MNKKLTSNSNLTHIDNLKNSASILLSFLPDDISEIFLKFKNINFDEVDENKDSEREINNTDYNNNTNNNYHQRKSYSESEPKIKNTDQKKEKKKIDQKAIKKNDEKDIYQKSMLGYFNKKK